MGISSFLDGRILDKSVSPYKKYNILQHSKQNK